jgi:outer membrane protein OmpA-like peptidoglycan-associated protein
MKGFESTIKKSIGLLTDKEDSIQVINLGKTINTTGAEWDPIPTPDGKYLFMSVRDRIGGEGRQDVFYAEQKKDTLSIEQWDTPLSVGPGVNTRNGEETVDNVSADGNTLLLSGTFPGSYGRFDIYTAERTENGWDNLRQLPKPINSEHHDESGCLTSDGKALLFSSDRPGAIGNVFAPMNSRYHGGGNGNMDIYICIKSDTGWTNPINLGTTINTPFSERSLFLHPDGKTLYFSSDGHYGIGGLDVFKSTRLSDTSWTQWSEPVNLGRNINTVQDDFSYKITVGGDTAYFAAQNRIDGIGDWDIYKVVLPKHIRPQPVITIKGFVIDKSGKPVKAMIVWEDLKDGKSIGSAQSNPIDGSYIVVLPLGKNYGYYAKADGYFPVSANIDARKELKGNSKQKNIIMYPIGDTNSQEITLQLTNVFFDYGKDNLQSSSFPELNRLSEILLKHRFHFIKISGHTDDIGSDTYNLTLSLNRAKRVKQYLVKKGIQSNFIEIIGYGKSMPKVIGDTEEARIENRRVEISIK